jgi:hypothetical protein
MMPYDWGRHYLIPSKALKKYSGRVRLRADYDEDLPRKELQELGLSGAIIRVTNRWY